MVHDTVKGGWYKKADRKGSPGEWVSQETASVWTTKAGATGAIGSIRRYARRATFKADPEIVIIKPGPTTKKITLVRADDWRGLYIDGKLVEEGHRVDTIDVLTRLGIDAEQFWANDEWLCDRGRLPEDLKDVIPEDTKWNS
jgi:hypothetical protein